MVAIFAVAQDRAADAGQMRPDLVARALADRGYLAELSDYETTVFAE